MVNKVTMVQIADKNESFMQRLKKTPKEGIFFRTLFCLNDRRVWWYCPQAWCCLPTVVKLRGVAVSSASSIHPSFAKYTIYLNPETLTSPNYKWVWTSNLLIGEEVEVGHLVPWQVEVDRSQPLFYFVPHSQSSSTRLKCSVEVASSRTPVLSAPHSTAPCCPNLAHILAGLLRQSPAWCEQMTL